jgi:TolB protein
MDPTHRFRTSSTLAVLALGSVVLVGCDVEEDPFVPDFSSVIEVSATTAGDTVDTDGYDLRLGTGDVYQLPPNGTVAFDAPGLSSVEIEIEDVQANCEVAQGATRTVAIAEQDTVRVDVDVTCEAALLGYVAYEKVEPEGTEIRLWHRESGNVRTLIGTEQATRNSFPAISPDGTRVAFSSLRDGSYDLYLYDVPSDEVSRLTTTTGGAFSATWAPDGTELAFTLSEQADVDIYRIGADGTGLQAVTDAPDAARRPAWSPSGDFIAFELTDRDFDARGSGAAQPAVTTSDIYLVEPAGTGLTQLTTDDAVDTNPAWSPGGIEVAWESTRSAGTAQVFVADADGTNVLQLTESAGESRQPAWSPDGETIVFSGRRDTEVDLYAIGSDDSAESRLTDSAGSESRADFGPDRR